LFPHAFLPLQLLSLVASLGTVVLCGWYYRQRLDWGLAWLAALVLALQMYLVRFSTLVMSDAVYTFLSMLFLVLFDRQRRVSTPRLGWCLLIGLVATGAYLVRACGVALVGAMAVYFLVQRRWQGVAGAAVPFIGAYALLFARNTALGGAGASNDIGPSTLIPFVQEFSRDLPHKAAIQWLRDLPGCLVPLLSGPRISSLLEQFGLGFVVWVAGVVILLIVSMGYFIQVRKRLSLAELYVPAYVAILTIAPLSARYWLPLTPLLIYYFGLGLQSLAAMMPLVASLRWLAHRAVVLVLVVLALLHLLRDVQQVLDPVRNRIPDVALGAHWISANTPGDAVVMAFVPRVTYLYSNRKVVPFPDESDEHYDAYPDLRAVGARARLYEAIRKFGVSYVLVEPRLVSGIPFEWSGYIRDDIIPILEEDNQGFSMVYSDDSGLIRVYRVCQEVKDDG
jgi:4-amino-4-deoxy-L-arabinose transferase-like glycosyltransferase